MFRRYSTSSFLSLCLVGLVLLGSNNNGVVLAEDQKSPEAEPIPGEQDPQQQEQQQQPKEEEVKPQNLFNAEDHTDWGTYYDPQNMFCGKFDCYKILGFDYESYGRVKPDTKVITKRYRALSRVWHPDKSKHKDAKERFVKIARAYEVLTDNEKRKEYDYMRYNQEAYFQKYGAGVLWQYAPKSDATFIIIILLIAANWFTWAAQKQRWQNVADRLIKAALEDWSPSMGGTTESKHLREQALERLAAQDTPEASTSNGTATGSSKSSKGKGGTKKEKVSGKEKKRLEQESLKPMVTELVEQIHDFGAGFHKPTWRDLFIVRIVKFPYYFSSGAWWQTKYWIRRLQKKELNDDERIALTERAVGHVTWDLSSEEDREAMTKRDLWIMDNLVAWKEEQEVKTWSKADQKYYAKMKKKGIKDQ